MVYSIGGYIIAPIDGANPDGHDTWGIVYVEVDKHFDSGKREITHVETYGTFPYNFAGLTSYSPVAVFKLAKDWRLA